MPIVSGAGFVEGRVRRGPPSLSSQEPRIREFIVSLRAILFSMVRQLRISAALRLIFHSPNKIKNQNLSTKVIFQCFGSVNTFFLRRYAFLSQSPNIKPPARLTYTKMSKQYLGSRAGTSTLQHIQGTTGKATTLTFVHPYGIRVTVFISSSTSPL